MPTKDTTPEARARQLHLYREAGPDRRVEIAAEMSDSLRELARAGVRQRNPGYSDREVTRELLRIFYGLKVAR